MPDDPRKICMMRGNAIYSSYPNQKPAKTGKGASASSTLFGTEKDGEALRKACRRLRSLWHLGMAHPIAAVYPVPHGFSPYQK